jgi:isopropylmalate/homocitrate/citramalate synthase
MKKSGTGRVELFDTSLRDGLQQPNLEISLPNAVSLLQRMAAFGVRFAEIGFAGANQFGRRTRFHRYCRHEAGPLR